MTRLFLLTTLLIALCFLPHELTANNNLLMQKNYSTGGFCYAGTKVTEIPLSEKEYNDYRSRFYKKKSLVKIEDFDEAKRMLDGIAFWEHEDGPQLLTRIVTRKGGIIDIDDYFGFVAFFPEQDILLLEGGHGCDLSYNLTTGGDVEISGNPDISYISPDGSFRLSGAYGGQECSGYYLQKKNKDSYLNICMLEHVFPLMDKLCHISDAFWISDTELCLTAENYLYDGIKKYARMVFSDYKRTEAPTNEYIIQEKQAGNFSIGQDVASLEASYHIIETQIFKEEGNLEPAYYIHSEGIRLDPGFDFDTDEFTGVAERIIIKNDKYCTGKLIGTGSTLKEFLEAYPDAGVYYSYIPDSFWVKSPTLRSIHFILDKKGFTNQTTDLIDGDIVTLKASDFIPDTPIREVYIY